MARRNRYLLDSEFKAARAAGRLRGKEAPPSKPRLYPLFAVLPRRLMRLAPRNREVRVTSETAVVKPEFV